MNTTNRSLLALAAFCLGTCALAAQQPDQFTVSWSDPSRPGLITVDLISGNITVTGSNRKDVVVIGRARGGGRQGQPQADGLRRLAQDPGFTVEEERNVMKIEGENPNKTLDIELLVPTKTSLKLQTINNGVIKIDAVEGDLEIENTNGSILMTNVAGSVVANAVNGRVQATMTRVTAQKSMAFTTLNGNVDVTLPAATKANLKLRSDMGEVYTDFDIQLKPGAPAKVEDTRRNGGGRFQIEVNKALYGAINGGGPEIEMRTFNGSIYVRKGT